MEVTEEENWSEKTERRQTEYGEEWRKNNRMICTADMYGRCNVLEESVRIRMKVKMREKREVK